MKVVTADRFAYATLQLPQAVRATGSAIIIVHGHVCGRQLRQFLRLHNYGCVGTGG